MEKNERLNELFVSTKEVFKGRLLDVFVDAVKLPNGKESTREYIKHNGAVCVVPLTKDGNVIMEKQFRYPMGRVVRELPAGKLDTADEIPLEAAKRELKEETGYIAGKWTFLGKFYPSVAYTTECIYMYLAEDLEPGTRCLDPDEFLNVYRVPFNELVGNIENDEIGDGKTIAAVLKTKLVLEKRRV